MGALPVGLVLPLAACGGETGGGEAEAEPRAAERTIGVYSAVVRQLVTKDHTFGDGASPFDRIFIVDGVTDEAGVLPRSGPPVTLQPFSPEVREGLMRELADLPPVELVSDPGSVVIGKKRCAHVKENGVLITLGPISGGNDEVTVPNSLFFAAWAVSGLGTCSSARTAPGRSSGPRGRSPSRSSCVGDGLVRRGRAAARTYLGSCAVCG
jgi:hypothetical protein